MMTENKPSNRLAELGRVILATLAVLLFWSAVGFGFWPELAPRLMGLFRAAQPLRSTDVEEIESQYFDVQNNSDASERQVRRMVERLEQDYVTLTTFLRREPNDRIQVLLTNGNAPAYADRGTLYVFHSSSIIDLDTAPFFLASIIAGPTSGSFFFDMGIAFYTVEETGVAEGLTGQSADAWVVLLQQKEALMPLEQAWSVKMPTGAEGLLDFFRAMVEGGSFARWVVEEHGWDAAWALRAGDAPEATINMPLHQAEEEWLAAVAAQDLQPNSCILSVPSNAVFRDVCQQLETEKE